MRRVARWLDATPHPPLAIEIGLGPCRGRALDEDRRSRRLRRRGSSAWRVWFPLRSKPTIVNAAALKSAISGVCSTLRAKDESVALILPDPVIRVFVQHFDDFPRSKEEADPMLRWKLKKSVPFEVDETLISYMRQAPREAGVDVVTALARLRIVREYESLVEAAGLHPGVVLSSSLAAIALAGRASRPRSSRAFPVLLDHRDRPRRCSLRLPLHGIARTAARILRRTCSSKTFIRSLPITRTPGRRAFNPSASPASARVCRNLCGRLRKSFIAKCARCFMPPFRTGASRGCASACRPRTGRIGRLDVASRLKWFRRGFDRENRRRRMKVRLNLATKPLEAHRKFLAGTGLLGVVAALVFLGLGWHVYLARKANAEMRAKSRRHSSASPRA